MKARRCAGMSSGRRGEAMASPSGRALRAMNREHDQDNRPEYDLPYGVLDLHEREDRRQERDENGANEGSGIGAAAAKDRRAAEHHGRDDRHQVAVAHALVSLVGVADQQEPAETRHEARKREDADDDPLDLGAREEQGARRLAE